MTHTDWREVVWKRVFAPLHGLAESVGFYTKTRTGEAAYVGTVGAIEREVEHTLRDVGLKRSLLSSVHTRTTSDGVQVEDSAYVWRDSLFDPFQVHVIVFANPDGTTDLYAHYERNPWATPLRHVDGDGYDVGAGVRRARRLLYDQFDWAFQGDW